MEPTWSLYLWMQFTIFCLMRSNRILCGSTPLAVRQQVLHDVKTSKCSRLCQTAPSSKYDDVSLNGFQWKFEGPTPHTRKSQKRIGPQVAEASYLFIVSPSPHSNLLNQSFWHKMASRLLANTLQANVGLTKQVRFHTWFNLITGIFTKIFIVCSSLGYRCQASFSYSHHQLA